MEKTHSLYSVFILYLRNAFSVHFDFTPAIGIPVGSAPIPPFASSEPIGGRNPPDCARCRSYGGAQGRCWLAEARRRGLLDRRVVQPAAGRCVDELPLAAFDERVLPKVAQEVLPLVARLDQLLELGGELALVGLKALQRAHDVLAAEDHLGLVVAPHDVRPVLDRDGREDHHDGDPRHQRDDQRAALFARRPSSMWLHGAAGGAMMIVTVSSGEVSLQLGSGYPKSSTSRVTVFVRLAASTT